MTDSRSRRLARALLDRPVLPALVLAVAVGVIAWLLPKLRVDAGLELFLDRSAPVYQVLDRVNDKFVSDEVVFVAYHADDVFARHTLHSVRELGARFESLTFERDGQTLYPIEEITSLTTLDTLVGSDQSFQAVPLVPDPIPEDEPGLAEVRRRAHANPIIAAEMLDAKDEASVMVLRLVPDLGDVLKAELIQQLREMTDDAHRREPRLSFHVLGNPVVDRDMAAYQTADLERFVPVTFGLVAVLLFLFLRRALGVGLALLNAAMSILVAMTVLVATGSTLNNCSVMLPPVMLALSVATIVHFVAEYGKNAMEHPTESAPLTTLGQLLSPVFMCSLTTAVGFGALAVSNVPGIRQFGVASALAMLAVFVVTSSLVALAMRRFTAPQIVSTRGIALSSAFDGVLRAYADFLVRRHKQVLAAALVGVSLISAGIARIVVDQSQTEFLPAGSPVRVANDFMNDELGGSTLFVISVETPDDKRFLRPEELRKLEALEGFLRQELGAQAPVTSLADFLSLMHRELYDGDPARHRVPDTAEQAAQLMLLNGDTRVEQFVDASYRWVRVVARGHERSAKHLAATFERIDAHLAEHFPTAQGYHAEATGQSRVLSTLALSLMRSQSTSLGLSIVLIFIPIILLFRSLRTGLYSIPPNVLPIVVTLGTMGWLGIELNMATVMIATVALGIAVDDTVHFLEHYRGRLAEGLDPEASLRRTLHTKGPGIFVTTAVISTGFGVMTMSSFTPTQHFGGLCSLAMLAALLGDVVFLPALLLTTRTRLGTGGAAGSDVADLASAREPSRAAASA